MPGSDYVISPTGYTAPSSVSTDTSGTSSTTATTTTTATTDASSTTTGSTGTTSTSSTSGTLPSITFQDNILGSYANPTYHIKFFTAGDAAYSSSTSSSTSTVIIAETGVTGYNIRELTVRSAVSIDKKNRNVQALELTLTIVEPMGVSFLDALVQATAHLNTSNFQKSDYYLEISFKGYNEDGSINTNLCSVYPNGGKWLYKVFIKNIDVDLTTSGGEYTLALIPRPLDVVDDQTILRTLDPYNISANSIGEMFSQFASALNKSVTTKYGTDRFTYAFDFQKTTQGADPNSFVFIETSDDPNNPFWTRPIKENEKSKFAANIPVNTSIVDIINGALSSTKEAQELIRDSNGKITGQSIGTGDYRDAGIFKIFPEVTLGEFDQASKNYKKKITFHIKMFVAQGTLLKTEEVTDTSNSAKAVNAINQYGGLKKRYDYIFTGLNTEVLDFNMKFKFAGQTILSKYEGYFNYNENIIPHAKYNPQQKNQLQTLASDNASAQSQALKTVSGLSTSGFGTPTSTNLNSGVASSYTIGGGGLTSFGLDPSSTSSSSTSTNTDTSSATSSTTALSTTPSSTPSTTSTTASNTVTTTYVENLLDAPVPANPFPLSTIQATNGGVQSAGNGFIGQWHRNKSIYGTIMNQLTSDFADVFMNIDLSIRGDPFWLGLDYESFYQQKNSTNTSSSTNSTSSTSSSSSGSTTSSSYDLPDYSLGDNCFILTFNYPYMTSDDGSPQLRSNDTFTGLYCVQYVENSFSGGAFKQTLKAYRAPNVTPDDAKKLLSNKSS